MAAVAVAVGALLGTGLLVRAADNTSYVEDITQTAEGRDGATYVPGTAVGLQASTNVSQGSGYDAGAQKLSKERTMEAWLEQVRLSTAAAQSRTSEYIQGWIKDDEPFAHPPDVPPVFMQVTNGVTAKGPYVAVCRPQTVYGPRKQFDGRGYANRQSFRLKDARTQIEGYTRPTGFGNIPVGINSIGKNRRIMVKPPPPAQ